MNDIEKEFLKEIVPDKTHPRKQKINQKKKVSVASLIA